MRPAVANLEAAANAYDTRTITIPGYASAAGVSATVEIRSKQDDTTGELYLMLEDGAGLTLTSDGTDLSIVWEITETQMDALRADIGGRPAYYSLKVTDGDGRTHQYLYGTYTVLRTATQ